MRKLIFILLSLIFLFAIFSTPLYGQQEVYPTKTVNGVEYYMYTVQAGEGLYAISKRFNVSQADINAANPQLASGIRAGEQVLIPTGAKAKVQADQPKNNSEKNASEQVAPPVSDKPLAPKGKITFVEHEVEKKQTLFGISRKYHVSQEDIRKYNPEIEDGLKEGMMLRIPVTDDSNDVVASPDHNSVKAVVEKPKVGSQEKESPKESKKEKKRKAEVISITDTTYIVHTVKKKETLFTISQLYNVPVEDIVRQNPGATDKLKTGSELRFKRRVEPEKKLAIVPEPKKEPAQEEIYNTKITNKVKYNKEPIRLAFMLPFMLDNKLDNSGDRFAEFYAGALLAINEAKNYGVSLEVYAYDTEKTEDKINQILQNPELRNVDLIIGPAFSNQISYVTDFARENRVNTLIPFSSKVLDLSINPYVYQFNPSDYVQEEFLAEYLNSKFKRGNIVFVNLDNVSLGDDGNDLVNDLRRKLTTAGISYKQLNVVDDTDITGSDLLNGAGETIVFFNTDKFSLVSKYLDLLNGMSNASNLLVFTQYSWQNNRKYNFKTLSVAPFKREYNEKELPLYEEQFNSFYDWKPDAKSPRYDLLGYDLTAYFISQIYRNGTNFGAEKNKLPTGAGIQSHIKFERNSSSNGFMNKQLYIHLTE
jgi:LysM repeat protein